MHMGGRGIFFPPSRIFDGHVWQSDRRSTMELVRFRMLFAWLSAIAISTLISTSAARAIPPPDDACGALLSNTAIVSITDIDRNALFMTKNQKECCAICNEKTGCKAWTWIKEPTENHRMGECWISDYISEFEQCDHCDSGLKGAVESPYSNGKEKIGAGLVRVGGFATIGRNREGFQLQFVDKNCRPFVFSGYNCWEVVEAAAGVADALPKNKKNVEAGRKLVRWIMNQGLGAGLTVLRFFGHGWNPNKFVLQEKPGKYNETNMLALDYVLAEANRKRMKVVMTFGDNWKEGDGRKQYADWADKDPMDFYTDKKIKGWYKDHISYIVNRRNNYTGTLYKHDPAIFAWNLINEPRCDCRITEGGPFCELSCAKTLNKWIHEMAEHLKSEDPNHMVTVGEEGFYSLTKWRTWVNPDAFSPGGSPWAERAGQDYCANHNSTAIDYLGIHAWPDNWGLAETWFNDLWIREHMSEGWWMEKPFVVEEFGKTVYSDLDVDRVNVRDPFLKPVYENFQAMMKSNQPMRGVMFWEFDAAEAGGKLPGPYGIRPTHSTWTDLIMPYGWGANFISRTQPLVRHCAPGANRSQDAIFIAELGDGFSEDDSKQNVYYATHGHQLHTVKEGKKVGWVKTGVSGDDCAVECEKMKGCTAFKLNPNIDDGKCIFLSKASEEYEWSKEGWQIFYKKKANKKCVAKTLGCRFCDDAGACIKCMKGDLIWDDATSTAICKHAPAPHFQNFEFNLPYSLPKPAWQMPTEGYSGLPFYYTN